MMRGFPEGVFALLPGTGPVLANEPAARMDGTVSERIT